MNKGESIPKLRDRIVNRVDKIGAYRAQTMARTETINSFTRGSILRYQQAGVEEAEWLTARDDRVCNICGPLNGKKFRLDSRHETPAIHPNCRCALLPVLK